MTKSARAIVELLEANFLVRRPSSATLMNLHVNNGLSEFFTR